MCACAHALATAAVVAVLACSVLLGREGRVLRVESRQLSTWDIGAELLELWRMVYTMWGLSEVSHGG